MAEPTFLHREKCCKLEHDCSYQGQGRDLGGGGGGGGDLGLGGKKSLLCDILRFPFLADWP